jgi:uncharacterized protein (DUF2062 family)
VSRLRALFRALFHLEDSPNRVAVAFGIGVFIAFFPILGIHTALALLIAVLFRLSKVAILTGAWTNNPWTIGPMFIAGTLVGCALLGVSPEGLHGVDWSLHGPAFYEALFESLRPLVLPFLVGNLVVGFVGGALSYIVLRMLLEKRRVSALPGPVR